MSIISDAVTHIGSVRTTNEDAILDYADAGLWAVADGMGGHEAGDYASQCIIEHLTQAGHQYRGRTLVDHMAQVLAKAHSAIFQHSQQLNGSPLIGSTIVILILEDDNYHCFWSGDSRCYLLRDNALTSITRDHTEAEELRASGQPFSQLSADDAIRIENTLTHAIGIDCDAPYIEYVTGNIYENDAFFLCSDGINKIFSDEEILNRLLNAPIEKINQDFIEDSHLLNAPDNLSSIIVNIN